MASPRAGAGGRDALFVVSIFNYHREVFPVVSEFVSNGWRVHVLLGWIGRHAEEARATYEELGCTVLRLPDALCYVAPMESGTPSDDGTAGAPRAADSARQASMARRLLSLGRISLHLRKERGIVSQLIEQVRPDAILSGPFHSCGRFDNAVAAYARSRKIPFCCYAVSAYWGSTGAIRARFQNLRAGMLPQIVRVDYDLLNRLLARCFPKWVKWEGRHGVYMWDPIVMLASKFAGLLERDVWQKPPSDMDAVFSFSAFSSRFLESDGYPMERVVNVGMPLLDTVFRCLDVPSHRTRLHEHIGLIDGAPFILFNVEPSAEHHYANWDVHWKNFRSLMEVLRKIGLPVVLSLHPLCRFEDYVFAEAQYGVRISRDYKIHDLYPYCSIAVSFPCSTNILAGMFNRRLVIYDFFDMAGETSRRADEYRLPGALIGSTSERVEELLLEQMKDGGSSRLSAGTQDASRAIREHVEHLVDSRKTVACEFAGATGN